MFYVLLSLALLLFALALRNSILARKKEKWGCLSETLSMALYLCSIALVGIAMLKFPEKLPPMPDFSDIFEIPAETTSATTEAVTPPPAVPEETTLPPLTLPPLSQPTNPPAEPPAATVPPTTAPTEPPATTVPPTTAPTEPPATTVPPTTETPLEPGWHLGQDGSTYYIDDDGSRHTGWLKLDGETFYFDENGVMVRGEVEIEGKTYHFASRGQRIILVNPWNPVPADYRSDLVNLTEYYGVNGTKVDRSCYDALIKMINDCNAECPRAAVVSAYRSYDYQTKLFENKVNNLVKSGMSNENARSAAATVVALPGTSEHQLGLAVDIIDTRLWALEEEQKDLPAQQWLMENCWKYGFILRYPENKTEITGIIYEPWHYRYVGKEIAAELYVAGITLEEYIQLLTKK